MDTLGRAIISGGPSEWKVWAMRCLQGCVDDAHGFFFELRTRRKTKNSTEISPVPFTLLAPVTTSYVIKTKKLILI